MSVANIYKSYLYNQSVKSLLEEGNSLTSDEFEKYIIDNIDTLDLSVPQFNSDDYKVDEYENASASKSNLTAEALKQDLTVLYKTMLAFGQGVTEDFDRWKTEISILDKRLLDLENRIDNLLLIAQDTEGYHSYFLDNLTDLFNVDISNSDVALDTASQVVFLNPTLSTGQETTRVFLQGLTDNDWSYKIRTFGASVEDERTVSGNGSPPPPAIFDQNEDTYWWIQVRNIKNSAVTVELTVKLGDSSISISSIYTSLHTAGGIISVTPLYSTDNYNFVQLPSNTVTIETDSMATFGFTPVEAQWVKFILTRESANTTVRDGDYRFEFGFNEISFYSEGFTKGDSQSFISKPLYITDTNGNISEFSKIALDVCEDIPANTSIEYFVTPGGSSDFSIDSNTKWYPISPLSRANPKYPQVLNLGDISEIEIGDNETVVFSYDASAEDSFKNPAQSFHLLSLDSDDTILDETISTNNIRFVPSKNNELILNYQIKDIDYTGSGSGTALDIDEDSVVILRNIGAKGLIESDTVRGVQRGWRFDAPYYITLVEILDSNGVTLDFGSKEVIVDNSRETGVTTISGKTESSDGIHEIKVHRDNWKSVIPGLNTLSELVAADSLYPYNHKLLIEGYEYGDSWLGNVDKVYQGVDLFFERRTKQISLFDLSENLDEQNRYSYFALDRDIADTHTDGNSSTRVFVLKADISNADFINEQFVLRFISANQRYSYLRFRADLSTNDSSNSPVMGPYKLKFAG